MGSACLDQNAPPAVPIVVRVLALELRLPQVGPSVRLGYLSVLLH